MKKIFHNNRLIAVAFLTMFFSGTTLGNDSNHINPSVPVALKFAGMIKNDPLFQLSIDGDQMQDEFTISITDCYGNNLFRENIRSNKFTKNFLLNSEELGDENIRFEICNRKTKRSIVYEISSNTRIVKETVTNRVN